MELDKTKTPLEQAHQICRIIGHNVNFIEKPVSTIDGNRWVEFSVMVPDDGPRTWRKRWTMIKLFWRVLKG